MNCKEFSNLLDACEAGTLPQAEAGRMEAHAAECEACGALLTLRRDCRRADEEIQVPEAFSSSWRRMIGEESTMEEKARKKPRWKAWAAAAAALVFVVGGTLISRDRLPARTAARDAVTQERAAAPAAPGFGGMAKTGAANSFVYDGGAVEAYEDMYALSESAAADVSEESGRQEKIIRSASFTVKTTDYEGDLARLQDLAAEMGGRVEYLSSSGDASSGQARSASLTLRIPAQALDRFLEGAGSIGNVTAMTQEMEDVSDSYYDIMTRLETQTEKMKRLQKMISSAKDVSDLIEIESAIADTQYYIDRYTGQLKSYDGKVDYSTVRVTVREVKVREIQEDVTLGQRILDGLEESLEAFAEFLEDMVIFIVSALPWLIVLGIAVILVRVIVKRKRKKERKEP